MLPAGEAGGLGLFVAMHNGGQHPAAGGRGDGGDLHFMVQPRLTPILVPTWPKRPPGAARPHCVRCSGLGEGSHGAWSALGTLKHRGGVRPPGGAEVALCASFQARDGLTRSLGASLPALSTLKHRGRRLLLAAGVGLSDGIQCACSGQGRVHTLGQQQQATLHGSLADVRGNLNTDRGPCRAAKGGLLACRPQSLLGSTG
jgi:hypothetical protein